MTVTDLLRAELHSSAAAAVQGSGALGPRTRGGKWRRTYTAALVAADIAVAALVGLILVVGRDPALPLAWALSLPLAWLVMAALAGAYRPNLLGPGAHDLRSVGLAGVGLGAVVPLILLAGVEVDYDAGLAVGLGAVTLGAGLARWMARAVFDAQRRSGLCTQRMFVVGDADAVVDMVERLGRAATGVVAVGVAVPASDIAKAARLGLASVAFDDDIETLDTDRILAAAHGAMADGVLLAPGRTVENEVLRRVARTCEWDGLPLFLAPAVVDVASSAPVSAVAGLPVLAVSRPGPGGTGRLAKSLLDRVVALLGLALLAPMLLATAAAVRLDSRGPALFLQVRVGANGETFTMVKFRTMHVGADQLVDDLDELNASDGNMFKIRHDPRLTRLGRFLRTSSIDELPQLLNVLVGHMSLVGPRPPLPREVGAYTSVERRRLLVKPGMTGLWQVGGRSNLSWADTVRLDLRYVDSWSLPLDARILARTLPEVLNRNGAF